VSGPERGDIPLIKLTSLDGADFLLNAELIRTVEARPDTYISLTTGERMVVQETLDDVWRRTIEYQRSKLLIPAPLGRSRPAD
jgi:flagellar protein FlbD